jgi:2-methylcitrate dehydratase PrpD
LCANHLAIVEQINFCLLDYLGATIAGTRISRDNINLYLQFCDVTDSGVSPVGFKKRIPLVSAAFVNGLSSHSAEMDDGYRFGMSHPGAPIFSALLPLLQKYSGSTELFNKAVVAGYEVVTRLSAAIQPSHYVKGYHPTATCGAVGVAAAVAVYLKATEEQLHRAIVAATVCCGGSLKAIEGKSQLKPQNIANAVSVGLNAAYLAMSGFDVPEDGFSGNTGFFAVMSLKPDLSELVRANEPFKSRISDVYFKPYAACRHAHSPIEAALKIKANTSFDLSLIKKIEVQIYESVIGKHDSTNIVSINSAKMSIPFSIAVALLRGSATITDFESDVTSSNEIRALCKKVEVIGDAELTKLVPQVRPSIVTVRQSNGVVLTHRVDLPKGEPERAMNRLEAEQKFIELSCYAGFNPGTIDKFLCDYWNYSGPIDKKLEQLLHLSDTGN